MLWLSIALGAEVDAQGDARLLGSLYPDFEVDADGGTTGQKAVLETRLRVGVDLAFSDGDAFHLEGDVLDAQVLGNPWQLGAADTRRRDVKGLADASAYVIRRASFTSRTGPVLWEAGLQTSQWGLGLVANNGTADPLFGRVDGGDTVLRLKGSTMPLGAETPLYLVLSADRVYADDAARWLDGQAAYQGVLALLWRGDVELGAYGVLRHQREEDRSLRTTAGVVDVYGRVPVITGETSVSLGWEAAGIVGQTSRAASYNSTSGLKLRSGGGL